MSQYDIIRRLVLIDSPETVNTDWTSPAASLDDRLGPFSITLLYDNGTSANMVAKIEYSNDGILWAAEADDTNSLTIDDESGSISFDINGSGMQFVRVSILVIGGSIDVTYGEFLGAQFH